MLSMLPSYARVLVVAALLLPAACMKAPEPSAAGGNGPAAAPTSGTPQLIFTAPPDWTAQPPSMAIFLGQWQIPDSGIANVSWMPNQGSTAQIAANVDRWLAQWEVPGSTPQESYVATSATGYYAEQRIVLKGTLTQTRQVGGGEPRSDWMMVGVVLDTPRGPAFVKVLGPQASLEPQLDTLFELIGTMRLQ